MREPSAEASGYVAPLIGLAFLVLAAAVSVAFLIIGTSGEEGRPPAGRATPGATAPATSPGAAPVVEIKMIPTIRFDQDELTVQQGQVTVRADNADGRTSHNFAVYQSQDAAEGGEDAIAATEICGAPCVDEVSFETPSAGEYFFRCDVHPQQMVGTFVVQ